MIMPRIEAPIEAADGMYVAVTILNPDSKAITIPMLNAIAMLTVRFKIHEGDQEDPSAPSSRCPIDHLTAEQLELLKSADIDPDNRLTEAQLLTVRQTIARRIAAFALNNGKPNQMHLTEVKLPLLPDARPHRHAPSRVGPEGQKLIEEEIQKMEANGIIRKSNSAWASRVVLVTKKDGSVRFCVDYRDVNSKLHVEDSPLPLTAEAIDRLSSGKGSQDSLFLCTLDLASGFWGLPLYENHKHITAFCTHRGKYEFNFLPFGVQSGPSYMCRVMDAVLEGLAWDICMPYLDDVGVWATGEGETLEAREAASFDQMLHRLDLVLERMIWAGLTCKMKKCKFFVTEAE